MQLSRRTRGALLIAPRDVTPGKNYGAAIIDAISECEFFVLILSSRSNDSQQVVGKVERAASTQSVLIPLPVRLRCNTVPPVAIEAREATRRDTWVLARWWELDVIVHEYGSCSHGGSPCKVRDVVSGRFSRIVGSLR